MKISSRGRRANPWFLHLSDAREDNDHKDRAVSSGLNAFIVQTNQLPAAED